MRTARFCVATIRSNLPIYCVCNVAYYLGIVVASLFAVAHPALQQKLLASIDADFAHGWLSRVAAAYLAGNVPAAALLTFLVNSILGSFAFITLPSCLVPFSGAALGLCRSVLWGLALTPRTPAMFFAMIPHTLCILLEGQAYILAMFGCCLWGKWLLHPSRAGFPSLRQAYFAGLVANLRLYALILPVLAVSALYESAEVIAIKTLLGR